MTTPPLATPRLSGPKLSGPMLPPRSGEPPRQLVVLLHGYGADGKDLISLASHWREVLPHALFVSPNGPTPASANPAGFQWFDIPGDDPAERVAGAAAAQAVIRGFLDDLWAQTGLGPEQTVLVGFSQGAMMALNVGLGLVPPVLGIVAFSGMLIPPPDLGTQPGRKPPVCLVHGEIDQVVPLARSLEATDILRRAGYEVNLHTSRGVGHGIDPDGLAFASSFLTSLAA